jgi:hypothetical protein
MSAQAKEKLQIDATPTQMPAIVPADANSIMAVISRAAADPNVDVSKLERLLDMHARIQAQHARVAYAAALSEMQPNLPAIEKRGKIDIGRGKPQAYALWEDINDAIKPVLQKHGFAISFRVGQMDGKISVTGVLSHREGHSEETTIYLPSDTSGSKNAVQAVGSSTSYGKRYTAAALLNLTARGEDDDAKAAGGTEFIAEDQAAALRDKIEAVGADKAKFLKHFNIADLGDLPVTKYRDAVAALDKKASAK